MQIARDPKIMYLRWKGRIEKGIKTMLKEKDPEKRKQMEYMLSRQRTKLAKLKRAKNKFKGR